MTALPRTRPQILERIGRVENTDFFGVQVSDLILALPFEEAREFLKPEVTAADWTPRLSAEEVTAAAVEYLAFAVGKASDHRGLSASRSIDHFRAWLWLLGRDEEIDWGSYVQYGVPILKQVAGLIGPTGCWMSLTTPELERMAAGQRCRPGCPEGCAGW